MGVVQLSDIQKVQWLIKGEDVQTLYYHEDNEELWMGTFNNGLWIKNLNNPRAQILKEQSSGFLNPIRAITAYDAHTMLVGIDGGGVYTVDLKTKHPHLLMSTEDSTDLYLRGNGIYAVVPDH